MTIEQHHTYCAMCTSRCGVLATVEDGVLKKVNAAISVYPPAPYRAPRLVESIYSR